MHYVLAKVKYGEHEKIRETTQTTLNIQMKQMGRIVGTWAEGY